MATILDERTEEESTKATKATKPIKKRRKKRETLVEDPLAALEAEALEANEQPETTESDSTAEREALPEKYQGKSAKELVQMHQEAEKLLGKQSSEVGDLRRVVDDYIQAQLTDKQAPQEESVEEVDFFTDPDKAVQRAIENHPKIKEAETLNQEYRKSTALAQLRNNHPDMEDILQDQKFADWIKGSKIRTQLFIAADQQFNHEAADELFSLWKERQQVVSQTAAVEKQGRRKAVKSASTGSARGSADSKGPKKIYRRSDIIKLMRTDPEKYQSLSEEIFKAYQEKRVR